MPKEKGIISDVPRLYKVQALDNIMFGYVLGMKTALPSLSIERCVDSFMQEFDLSEDEYSRDSALCQFYRYFDLMRKIRRSFIDNN
jgi:hypothetical protein